MTPHRSGNSQARLWLDGILAFCLPLMVYAGTASRTVMPEDDGLFILAAYFNGVAHPPGYPLFTLLAHPFSWLPLESVAFRIHLASAVFAASAVLAAWWTMLAIPGIGRVGALTAALALGVSATFWSQAIIAEVYCLNAALFLLILGMSIRYVQSAWEGQSGHRLLGLPLIALVFGLSLSNHWPLTVLGCSGLAALYATVWWRFVRDLPLALPFAALGLLPYLWLFLRSQMGIPISFYGPLTSWDTFFFMLSREGYAEVDNRESAQFVDKLYFAAFFLTDLVHQFRLPGFALGVIGFVAQWRRWPRSLAVSLTLSFVCSSLLLALMLGFDYSSYYRAIFRVYPIVANAIWAIWLGLGVSLTIQLVHRRLKSIRWNRALTTAICGLLILHIGTSHAPANDRHRDDLARHYARTTLKTLPANAIVFVSGDMYFGPLVYTHIIDGVRPDITLFNPLGLILGNRLFHPLAVMEERQIDIIKSFITASERPVCVIGHGAYEFAFAENWLFQCLRPEARPGDNSYQVHGEHLAFLQRLIHEPARAKPWHLAIKNHLLQRMGELSTFIVQTHPQEELSPALIAAHRAAMTTTFGKLGALRMLLQHIDPELKQHADLVKDLLQSMPAGSDWAQVKQEVALLHFLSGQAAQAMRDPIKAREAYIAALDSWWSPANPAAIKLLAELVEAPDSLQDKTTHWLRMHQDAIEEIDQERR